MTRRFENRVVVITGGGGGLGRTSALAFGREGARLALIDVNAAGLEESAALLRELGAECSTHVADLTDEQAIAALAAELCQRYPAIHVLYNNAGAAYGEVTQSVETIGLQKWLGYLTLNSLAPLLLAQALRPALAVARGVVLNQSSMAANMPATVYGVTKATLNSLTYGMATAFGGDGIRVNAIAPGLMLTPAAQAGLSGEQHARVKAMQLLDLDGTAEDIARLALFLASDEARFINCEIVNCDAGNRIRGWRH